MVEFFIKLQNWPKREANSMPQSKFIAKHEINPGAILLCCVWHLFSCLYDLLLIPFSVKTEICPTKDQFH